MNTKISRKVDVRQSNCVVALVTVISLTTVFRKFSEHCPKAIRNVSNVVT